MKKHWIAIDWGTTNFRAFLMNENHPLARVASPCGLLSVENHDFTGALYQHLEPWVAEAGPLPILLAGMVGSQQGWNEVSYASLPANGITLLEGIRPVSTPWGSPAWIVPGLCDESPWQQPDVMRGEEIQLLGLSALHPSPTHFAILPGTHSKHARMEQGNITAFSTLMTGELFSLLTQHSLLGRNLPLQHEDEAVFLSGVIAAQHAVPFSHLIFAARTRRLSGEFAPEHIHSFISGLLIGHELSALPVGQSAWIVGSTSLATRYRLAARVTQHHLTAIEGDACFLRGMSELRTLLQDSAS